MVSKKCACFALLQGSSHALRCQHGIGAGLEGVGASGLRMTKCVRVARTDSSSCVQRQSCELSRRKVEEITIVIYTGFLIFVNSVPSSIRHHGRLTQGLRMIFHRRLVPLMVLAGGLQSAIAAPISTAFAKESYVAAGEAKGVVLIAVNWARRWKCGGFENAQLQSMGFDLVTKPGKGKSDEPDIALEPFSTLLASPSFVNYAFIVEPGEYQLSAFKLKAAKSIANIAYMKGDRSTLLVDGKSKAGSFTVAAGETVYVGHFAVDCAGVPMPWRFYPEDRLGFDQYLKDFAAAFPGLPVEKAKFRLFQTETMGNPFSLD